MKKNNQTLNRQILPALSMVLALLLGCMSGCAKTETAAQAEASSPAASVAQSEEAPVTSAAVDEPEASASIIEDSVDEAEVLKKEELDSENAALLDGEDRQFEREIAYRYYHGGEPREELSDTERNQWMSQGKWSFDSNGNGVFLLNLEGSMSQTWNWVEYTNDYGESWTSAGVYGVVTQIDDIKVAGSRVVFTVENGVTESRHNLVYSDDLCQSFRMCDTIAFAPDYLKTILNQDGSHIGMDLLSLDESDGSVMLAWYDEEHVSVSGFDEFNQEAENKRDYFLIGKTNPDFTQLQVLYSAKTE